MPGLEDEVRENRRTNRRINSYFREPSPSAAAVVRFDQVEIEVTATATVATRPLNDTLVAGGPAPSQAVGRGRVGDYRGGWSVVETTSTEPIALGGREAIAEALAGVANGLEYGAVGTDGSAPSTGDDALGTGGPLVDGWGVDVDASTTRGVAELRVTDLVDVVDELAIYDGDQDLVVRLTTSGIDPGPDQEVTIEVDLSFSDVTDADAAITTMDTISNSIRTEGEQIGLAELALGTDGTAPSMSDTSLGNEVVRKPVEHAVGREGLSLATVVFLSEPSASHDLDLEELAAIDQAGDLVWRQTFAPERKDDTTRLRPIAGLLIV